ncbi:MAG TPA: universal stress protein [Persephonella sp.]|uniref:Universal stress protein n=1 Tax=Persephonella marina (strain DSM 14350 / EX-H1) TaxID=123214 RepID=C0QPH8_PERMH|nr:MULTISPECIES: universal stress protein [Persephonella]ACO03332.1 stress response protein [Persephonella marina EX-H1]HCB69811.1 universal stress protein [Persephonella sp.]
MSYKNILVGYDGSDPSKKALKKAVELSKIMKSDLHIVGVVRPFQFAAVDFILPEEIEAYEKEEISKEERFLKEALEIAKESGIEAKTKVLEGEPAEELMSYADANGCDLIVVGHRGAGGFKRLILGTTAGNLVKYANQSVLVVK